MYQTVIIDDDINSRNAAMEALKCYKDINVIASFSCGKEFFEYAKNEKIELVFLDIELIGESGFDIAEKVQEKNKEISIIFLTGHASYAVDSFDFQPVYFLTKPINEIKLKKAIQCLEAKKKPVDNSAAKLMFKKNQGYRLVDVDKIYYIERRSRKNIVVYENEEFQIAYYTMNELLNMLEDYNFYMVHQSFIVSLSKINELYDEGRQTYWVTIKDINIRIPVSRKQYEGLRKALTELNLFK